MRLRLALFLAVAAAALPSAALADDAPACLAATGPAPDALSIRGVHVGGRATIRDADGKPLDVSSASYCVDGGGTVGFALSHDQDVVLVLSTAEGDAIDQVNPTSPAQSARMAFPNMKKLAKSGSTTVYRVDSKRQLLVGVEAGRVNFVAAADRLLLEYPNKLGYYLKRLDF